MLFARKNAESREFPSSPSILTARAASVQYELHLIRPAHLRSWHMNRIAVRNKREAGFSSASDALGYFQSKIEECATTKSRDSVHFTREARRLRKYLYTTLSPDDLRELLRSTMQLTDGESLVAPLFGAPPYGFLKPGDGWSLRAKGFAPSRVNIAYLDERCGVPTYSQFGLAHFLDESDREYRLLKTTALDSDLHNVLADAAETEAFIRIPKRRSRAAAGPGDSGDPAIRLQSESNRFPAVGSSVRLRRAKSIFTPVDMDDAHATTMRVARLRIAGERDASHVSSVAAVVLTS